MTAPSQDFVARSLELAREMLRDARDLSGSGSLRSAADRAYYAMFHGARAILRKEGVDLPRSHGGLQRLFGRELILSGKLPREAGRWFGAAYDLRQRSDYQIFTRVDREAVEETIQSASSFVELIERTVGKQT